MNYGRNKKGLFVVLCVLLCVGTFFFIENIYKCPNYDCLNQYSNALEDKAIKNGVVVDESKDKVDLSEKKFKEGVEKNKKISKKKNMHYYTLDDINLPKYAMPNAFVHMPPKGQNVDTIDKTPDPIDRNVVNKPFGKYVIFYPQHQDDEVLWAGSTIRYAVNTRGADHVFIALVSSGTGHKFFKQKMFKNMTIKQKAEYRNNEFLASCKALGIPRKNIFFLYERRPDWKTDFNIERKFALEMEKKYKSVTHITHSYKYDDHFMHRANGETLYKLWQKGEIKDLRFYIKPFLLKYVNASLNTLNTYSVYDKKDYEMIKNACKAYKDVYPKKKRLGIGYKTDYMSFDKLVYDRDEKSYIIIQNNKKRG